MNSSTIRQRRLHYLAIALATSISVTLCAARLVAQDAVDAVTQASSTTWWQQVDRSIRLAQGAPEEPITLAEPGLAREPIPVGVLIGEAGAAATRNGAYVITSGAPGCGDCPICGVQCQGNCQPPCVPFRSGWCDAGPIPWQAFAQGEYAAPARSRHVSEYRLRPDDELEFVFRVDGASTHHRYRIQVGDVIRIESLGAPERNQDEVTVMPDGYISLSIVGEVLAAGRTFEELQADLESRYAAEIKTPGITVSPVSVNTVLEELRNTVDNRAGFGGQSRNARVTPAGEVQLPAVGSINAQGLTVEELKREVEAAYSHVVTGMEVTPILTQRAPRFVYVLGEVDTPGRYTLEGPTTVMQAIALAGSWNVGANLRHIVIFRRDENWCLMATKVDIKQALFGLDPCPAGELWLRDSDIVVVPKHPILHADDIIELVFTRGIYSVFPVTFFEGLSNGGGLTTL